MKLRNKINLSLLMILLLTTATMLISGIVVINAIVHDLNKSLMAKELVTVRKSIVADYNILKKHGLLNVEGYVAGAKLEIFNRFRDYGVGEKNKLIIIDSAGLIVHGSDSCIHSPQADAEIETILNNEDTASHQTNSVSMNIGSKNHFSIYQRITPWDWLLVILVHDDELFLMRDRYIYAVAFSAFLVGALAMIFGSSLTAGMSRRINLTLEAMTRVAEGDLGFRLPQSRIKDETSTLQIGINKMTAALEKQTKQKELATQLLIQEHFYLEKAQELGQIGTWELDLVQNKLTWTDETYRIFGVPIGAEINYEMFTDMIHPEDRDHVDSDWKAALTENGYDIEHRIIVDGETKWVREKANIEFDDNGKAVRGLGFVQDISERKQAESTIREGESTLDSILRASPIGIGLTRDRVIVWTNSCLLKMVGYSEEELLGKGARLLYGSDEEFQRVGQVKYKEISERGTGTIETRFKRKDGAYVDVLLSSTPLDPSDLSAGVTFTVVDITKRKQAEEEKETLEAHLQQAYKMEAIGTMAGGIAHDFNNILSIILSNIELVQKHTPAGNRAGVYIDNIREAANRSGDLIKQILAFSRQNTQDFALVNITQIIEESLNLLRSAIPTTIELRQGFGEGCELITVNADPIQLQQVLFNLCTNSVHAMAEKGVLEVKLAKVELESEDIPAPYLRPAGTYAKISVCDTGKGMDQKTLNKVFEPFFTTKKVGEGTGLGLSVVHGVIENHNGMVTVDSTPGKGTTFHLYFPIAEMEGNIMHKTQESLPTGNERILFVDDEECIAYSCNELLEDQGYKVTSVTSSIKALDIFRSNPEAFDLVFTDQTMPEMSGEELATELLKIRPDIPIILCSGYSTKVSEADAKAIGIRQFCMKPMNMKLLATVARKVLDESGNHS